MMMNTFGLKVGACLMARDNLIGSKQPEVRGGKRKTCSKIRYLANILRHT